ncbi:MAG: glycoside hydrolase family 9 protein [Planctomycetia bacterium]|nr:glycoside hydrolase family 9 protein [Planctomycetia bacterium]
MFRALIILAALMPALSYGAQIPIPRRTAPEQPPKIEGYLRVAQIDATHICLTGYYQDFLIERFKEECGPFLRMLEEPEYAPKDWSRRFHYNFAALEVIAAYRPIISKAYQEKKRFKILDSKGREVPILRHDYWVNPISAGRFPDMATGRETLTRSAEISHHAYLVLAQPLNDGEKYTLTNPLGENVVFSYSESQRSEAIKVNQEGYSPMAGRKYAYLGAWLGPNLQKRDYSQWVGKPFFIVDQKERKVYRGEIVARNLSEEIDKFSGEFVCDLDFSDFNTEGTYQIYVPGVGRSWRFQIHNDAIGKSFYVRARGMYHKRCGTLQQKPYTAWESYVPDEMKKENPTRGCHMTTWQGCFPPNTRHYGTNDAGGGFFDKDGKKYKTDQFTIIREYCKTETKLPNVHGGWHDAADYDRRPFHLECVGDLVAAYLLCPENFSDNQLNLPESGNGVPDILDEAVWGTDVWRKAQNEKGGVGCWIEASSHPGNYIPATDEQPYFLALPTMEGTAQYSAYAASLAWALKKAGDEKRANLFLQSAIKAYQYATDKNNRVEYEYKNYPYREGGKVTPIDLTYRESDVLRGAELAKTAFNLYLLTKDKKYLEDFEQFRPLGFDKLVADLLWRGSPFYFAEFIVEAKNLPEFAEVYKNICDAMIRLADTRLLELDNNYQYRMPWYAHNHAYVSHTSWGNFHPLNRGRCFILAWKISGDTKYRDAAFLCHDWQMGANPTGSSMTSRLGQTYPARFLDLPSYEDRIVEFVPGITPYRNTYGLARPAVELAWGLFCTERVDHKFEGLNIPLLPKAQFPHDKIDDIGAYSEAVRNGLPIWRRFANLEGLAVGASEYTVSETLSPEAAVVGCLLTPGWKPSRELREMRPVKNLKEIPGFIALP